jgi:hypothetical protein
MTVDEANRDISRRQSREISEAGQEQANVYSGFGSLVNTLQPLVEIV